MSVIESSRPIKRSRAVLPPTFLHFSLGGFWGHSWELVWDKGLLWLREQDRGYGLLQSTPWQPYSLAERSPWGRLRRFLDNLKLWDWPDTFVDNNVMDGTQWSIEIHWGNQHQKTYGSNAFPDGFDRMERALRRLAKRIDTSREAINHLPSAETLDDFFYDDP